MKQLTSYSLRPERVPLGLVATLVLLIVNHVLSMQSNFNPPWD